MSLEMLQWLGCITGVAGSLLLALNTSLIGIQRWLFSRQVSFKKEY